MSEPILELRNLKVSITDQRDTQIIKGIDLKIGRGEVHALMGPNGSGKSTLATTIAGSPVYTVDSGQIIFKGEDITALKADARARLGLFLSFQYPTAIPGVTMLGTYEFSNAPARIVVYVDQVTPEIEAAVPDELHGFAVEIKEPLPVPPALDGVVKAIAPATAAQAAAGLVGTLTVKGDLRQEDHGSVTSSAGTLIVNVPSKLKIWRPMGEGKEFIGFGDIRTGDNCRVVLEAAPSGQGRAVTAADLEVYDRI